MKNYHFYLFPLLCIIFISGGRLNSIEKSLPVYEWQKLFDGESLSGWEVKCVEKDRSKEFWSVQDGMIICNSLGSTDHHYVWLQTIDEFDDFELKLKFQASRENKGNSGVQIRSRYDEEAVVDGGLRGWLDGPQVDINPGTPFRNGLIYDETRGTRRWIHPSLPDSKISEGDIDMHRVIFFFEDEGNGWNELRIVCKGNRIKTFVNKVKVADYDGTGVLDDAAHQKHRVGRRGHIALQLHKHSENLMCYKDIVIRPL